MVYANSYMQCGKVKVLAVETCPCLDKTRVLYLLKKRENQTLHWFKYER